MNKRLDFRTARAILYATSAILVGAGLAWLWHPAVGLIALGAFLAVDCIVTRRPPE